MPDSRASGSSFKDLPLHTSSKLSTKEIRNQGESSSDGGTGKKLSAAGALLKDKHPELFLVAPRPGGFIKNIGSPRRDPWKTESKKEVSDPSKGRFNNWRMILCTNNIFQRPGKRASGIGGSGERGEASVDE